MTKYSRLRSKGNNKNEDNNGKATHKFIQPKSPPTIVPLFLHRYVTFDVAGNVTQILLKFHETGCCKFKKYNLYFWSIIYFWTWCDWNNDLEVIFLFWIWQVYNLTDYHIFVYLSQRGFSQIYFFILYFWSKLREKTAVKFLTSL